MLVKFIRSTQNELQHSVIALQDSNDLITHLKEFGIPVLEIGMKNSIPTVRSIIKVRSFITQIAPDLIQGWMYHGNLAASVGRLNKDIPLIYNIRHSLHHIGNEKLMTRWVIRLNSFFSHKLEGIIYNSNISRNQHENLGFASNSSITIPNGFDVEFYKPNRKFRLEIRRELNLSDNTLLFGQVGRNHPMKGHKTFMNAALEVIKRDDSKCHFLLVGRGIAKDKNLLDIRRKLNMEEHITFFDQRLDIEKIWNAVDVGVLSSLWGEGFPNVIGEAMACANPCIVTDVGDTAHIVNSFGKVVPPDDVESLALAMHEMLSLDENRRKVLGKKARNRIINKFSIDEVSKKYMVYYKKIISKRTP